MTKTAERSDNIVGNGGSEVHTRVRLQIVD